MMHWSIASEGNGRPVFRVVLWDVHILRYEARQVFWLSDRFANAKFGIAYITNSHPAGRVAVVSW